MNTQVTARGMQVKATADSSLVINNNGNFGASFGTLNEVTFTDGVFTMKPATHATTVTGTSDPTTKYLQYVTNPSQISISTGKQAGAIALTYGDANVESTSSVNGYYKDYVVYIASATAELPNQTLKVKLNGTAATDTKKAMTVDFYLSDTSTISLSDYKGNLNMSTLDGSGNTAELTLATNSCTIPLYTETGSSKVVTVLMRVYFDGALDYDNVFQATGTYVSGTTYYPTEADAIAKTNALDPSGWTVGTTDVSSYFVNNGKLCYVRSSTVDLTDISFSAIFTLG